MINGGLPLCLIVDMDGTLANNKWRDPYAMDIVHLDSPNHPVLDLLDALQTVFPIEATFVFSGREETDGAYTKTADWLYQYQVAYDFLTLRAEGDHRPDEIVKSEMFMEQVEGKYEVKYVIDDRLAVCKMWFERGLPLLRVGDPSATF